VPERTSACRHGYVIFNLKKEKIVPKLKTNRGAAKRFKKTGTGKIKAKRAFARHILTKKSSNRKRVLRSPKFVEKRDAKGIKALVPYI
jgi:large subunit ribosomal protein L35